MNRHVGARHFSGWTLFGLAGEDGATRVKKVSSDGGQRFRSTDGAPGRARPTPGPRARNSRGKVSNRSRRARRERIIIARLAQITPTCRLATFSLRSNPVFVRKGFLLRSPYRPTADLSQPIDRQSRFSAPDAKEFRRVKVAVIRAFAARDVTTIRLFELKVNISLDHAETTQRKRDNRAPFLVSEGKRPKKGNVRASRALARTSGVGSRPFAYRHAPVVKSGWLASTTMHRRHLMPSRAVRPPFPPVEQVEQEISSLISAPVPDSFHASSGDHAPSRSQCSHVVFSLPDSGERPRWRHFSRREANERTSE